MWSCRACVQISQLNLCSLSFESQGTFATRQGDSVKIVVAFGQEADRRCSAGLERLDSPCGRVADALGHSTCGACQREDVLRGVIEAIGMAILTRGYVLVAVHRLDPPVAAVHRHDAFRCRPGQARDRINRLPFGSGDASPSDRSCLRSRRAMKRIVGHELAHLPAERCHECGAGQSARGRIAAAHAIRRGEKPAL